MGERASSYCVMGDLILKYFHIERKGGCGIIVLWKRSQLANMSAKLPKSTGPLLATIVTAVWACLHHPSVLWFCPSCVSVSLSVSSAQQLVRLMYGQNCDDFIVVCCSKHYQGPTHLTARLDLVWCKNQYGKFHVSCRICRLGETDFKLNRWKILLEIISMKYIPKAGLAVP